MAPVFSLVRVPCGARHRVAAMRTLRRWPAFWSGARLAAWMWLVASSGTCGAAGVTWNLDSEAEVQRPANLVGASVSAGLFHGTTTWDPYVWFRLPAGGVDGRTLTRLTVRLYSSAPADHLAIYYESGDGRWALGQSHPIVKGLAEYRVDLTQLRYGGDVAPIEGSRQWGGTTGRITSFRLDPGNESGRWIAIDQVRLEPATSTPFVPGVTPLATPAGRLVRVDVPAVVMAGSPIRVRVRALLPEGFTKREDRLVVWLMAATTPWAEAVVPARLGTGRQSWVVEFPTRKRAQPARLSVRVGLLGVGLASGGYGVERAVVRLSNPLAGRVRPPLAVVKPLGGDPALFVNDKPVAPFFVVLQGARPHQQRAEMARAGLHLFSDWFGSSGASDLGHVAPGRYDYTEFDRYFADALAADPDAWFLPHIGITPPAWWQQAHPEELCLYADGGRGPQSFASELWRKETARDLRRLIAHLQAAPYADRILGYIPFSGYSAEWQSWGLWQDHLADYSGPARRAWRKWLANRYGAGSPLVDAPMPTAEQRHTGRWGALRDADAERSAVDYYQFLADTTADAICYFARVVKEATHRRSLCGTYYGYLTQHGRRQQDSSHLALARALACPDIDFLMSPPMYTDRQVGGTSGFMSATESVRLHGKLWLSEADYRTHLSPPESGYGRTSTPAETQAVLWREMGNVLTRRTGVSHYDMEGGWLAGSEITASLGRMRRVLEHSLVGRRPFYGDLAVAIDERSFAYATAMHPLTDMLSLYSIIQLPRVGVAWDFVLLDDVVGERLPPHRLYLFLNAFRLDARQRIALRARLQRERATALWIYAPGLYGDEDADPRLIGELTGITVERQPWGRALRLADTEGVALAGDDAPVDPVFVPRDPLPEVLGLLAGSHQPGLVRRPMGEWTSIFSSAPQLTPAALRRLAREAGCHVYLETGDALFVDNRFVCVHASSAGEKVLSLRAPAATRVLFGPAPARAEGARLYLRMRANETVLVELGREPTPRPWRAGVCHGPRETLLPDAGAQGRSVPKRGSPCRIEAGSSGRMQPGTPFAGVPRSALDAGTAMLRRSPSAFAACAATHMSRAST